MSPWIEQLDGSLARHHPDYYGQLQAGVDEPTLDAFQTQLKSELPPAFRDLYQWRNGQNPDCSADLINNWMFSPLEDVISTKELLDGMIDTDFEEPGWWSRGWIPFLSNGGGDYLCLDLTAEFSGTAGQLLIFWHDEGRRPIKFDSMEAWLQAIITSLNNEP